MAGELISVAELVQATECLDGSPDLHALIRTASEHIRRECCRDFTRATRTETKRLDNIATVYLKEPPLVSVTSITIDGKPVQASEYDTASTDKVAAVMFRYRQRGLLSVTYVGGFVDYPYDLKRAAILLCEYFAQDRKAERAERDFPSVITRLIRNWKTREAV